MAVEPFPDEQTELEFARIFANQGSRSLDGKIVPGMIEIQFAPSAVSPATILERGRSGAGMVDQLLDKVGTRSLTPMFFAELPANKRQFSDFRDQFYVAEIEVDTDIKAACLDLMTLPEILTAWPVILCKLDRNPVQIVNSNDPTFDSQYYLKTGNTGSLKAKGAWGHSQSDSTIVVAILDTGVDLDHPDLAGPAPYLNGNLYVDWTEYNGTPGADDDSNGYTDDWRGWDFVHVTPGPYGGEDYRNQDNDPDDFEGHGTCCAGFVGAITDNGIGISSIGWNTRVLPVRIGWAVEDDGQMTGVSYSSYMASGFNYARVKGAHVANLSYGSSYTPALGSAVNSAWSAGMIITNSAGNDNDSVASYLATTNRCIDVASTDASDIKSDFSSYGTWVDVSAPGTAVYTTAIDGYTSTQGTSFSAPLTAGLVASIYHHLANGVRSQSNAAMVTQRLYDTCDDISDINPGYSNLLGAGRINAFLALGGGSFFSYPDEFDELQEALDFAVEGDTVAMQGSASGSGDVLSLDKNLSLLGGWDATYDNRTPATNRSTLQGNGINCVFILINPVIDATTIIDGFRIEQGGGQVGYYPDQGRYGGNMLIRAGSPTLTNLTFANADISDDDNSHGGGLFIVGVDLTLVNCDFENNSAYYGGGLAVHDSDIVLQNCSFTSNSARDDLTTIGEGGAMTGTECTVRIDGGNFTGNTAVNMGGAVMIRAGLTFDLESCLFDNNSASVSGGAIMNQGNLVLLNGVSRGNGDPDIHFGGSIHNAGGSTFSVKSCVFEGDISGIQGSVLYATESTGEFVNNTVDGIQNTILGSALALSNTSVDIRNCHFTNNLASPTIFALGPTLPTAAYNNFFNNPASDSDYQGFTSIEGDTHVDPLYRDQAAADFHLLIDSPALDKGDPTILDVDGGRSDIGAYGGPDADIQRPWRPQGVTVNASLRDRDYGIHLDWDLVTGAAGYAVYRDTVEDFEPTIANRLALIAGINNTDYDDSVPDETTVYYYKVTAWNADQLGSGYSDEVFGTGQIMVSVGDELPRSFALGGAWPNPFNPTTNITYSLPRENSVLIRIFAANGRQVFSRKLDSRPAGEHTWSWNGRDQSGTGLSSGIYTLRIDAGNWNDTTKLTLLK
ncbi:MAG: S8 family serine peptidase [bacterium]|nr:S8 family serine peptidase [bacterium]